VEWSVLIEGRDTDGPRHHSCGAPVHAGDGLCLLTDAGWLEGRRVGVSTQADRLRFFCSLPRLDIQASIVLAEGTLPHGREAISDRRQADPFDRCREDYHAQFPIRALAEVLSTRTRITDREDRIADRWEGGPGHISGDSTDTQTAGCMPSNGSVSDDNLAARTTGGVSCTQTDLAECCRLART
jgi:hypothetical protein